MILSETAKRTLYDKITNILKMWGYNVEKNHINDTLIYKRGGKYQYNINLTNKPEIIDLKKLEDLCHIDIHNMKHNPNCKFSIMFCIVPEAEYETKEMEQLRTLENSQNNLRDMFNHLQNLVKNTGIQINNLQSRVLKVVKITKDAKKNIQEAESIDKQNRIDKCCNTTFISSVIVSSSINLLAIYILYYK